MQGRADALYDFNNFLLQKLVGPVFHQIATTMVDSFVKRADDVASARVAQRAATDDPA